MSVRSARIIRSHARRVAAAAVLAAALTAGSVTSASAIAVSLDEVPAAASTDTTPSFAGTAVPNSVVLVTIDGDMAGVRADPVNGAWSYQGSVGDGSHSWSVGGMGAPSGSGSFVVDTTYPGFGLSIDVDLSALVVGDEVSIGLHGNDASAFRFDVDLDGTSLGSYVNHALVSTLAGSAGSHTLTIVAVDALDNTSPPQSVSWTTRPAPAAPTVVDGTFAGTVGVAATLDLDSLVTAGTGSITSISISSVDDIGRLGLVYDPDTHVVTVTPTDSGTYWFQFQASSSDGLDSAPGNVSVTVADAPEVPGPVLTWVARPDASTTSTSAHFAVAADSPHVSVSYVLDLPEGSQSASPVLVTGSTFDLVGLSVGHHTIRIVVEDDVTHSWSALDHAWDVVAADASTPAVNPPTAEAPAPPARVLLSTAIPTAVIAPGVRQGASGDAVAIIQRVLGVTADGRFGPATRRAVVAFQRAHGLVADGIVGPLTWAALVAAANGGAAPALSATSIPPVLAAGSVHRGARGSVVTAIQHVVGASPDGRFGPRTQSLVVAWQRAHGLVGDGSVGPLTWAAMNLSS